MVSLKLWLKFFRETKWLSIITITSFNVIILSLVIIGNFIWYQTPTVLESFKTPLTYQIRAAISKKLTEQEILTLLEFFEGKEYDTYVTIGPKVFDSEVFGQYFYYHSSESKTGEYFHENNLGVLSLPILYVKDNHYNFNSNVGDKPQIMYQLENSIFYSIDNKELKMLLLDEYGRGTAIQEFLNNIKLSNLSKEEVQSLKKSLQKLADYCHVRLISTDILRNNLEGLMIYLTLIFLILSVGIILSIILGHLWANFIINSFILKTAFVLGVELKVIKIAKIYQSVTIFCLSYFVNRLLLTRGLNTDSIHLLLFVHVLMFGALFLQIIQNIRGVTKDECYLS